MIFADHQNRDWNDDSGAQVHPMLLTTLIELECIPEVIRECNDIEKKIPYLVPEDECVEVTFDECVEVGNVLKGYTLQSEI